MTPAEARAVLGIGPDASLDAAIEQHRRLQRRHHPDVSGDPERAATERSARLNEAIAVLRAAAANPPDEPVATPGPTTVDTLTSLRWGGPLDLELVGDSLFLAAPPDEAFLRLLDAGAGLGGIGHVDHRLGLLEVLVRFEGGPTCSVLLTLQGRAHGTEVVCEMESIEARPTPPIGPVLLALAEELRTGAAHPPPASPF